MKSPNFGIEKLGSCILFILGSIFILSVVIIAHVFIMPYEFLKTQWNKISS